MSIQVSLRVLAPPSLFLVIAGIALAHEQPRQDRAWKHYTNKQTNYCVSYPSRWTKAGLSPEGLAVTAGLTRSSQPIALLTASALNEEPQSVQTTPVNLTETYSSHVNSLRKFIRAERVQTVEQREFTLAGQSSLFIKAHYFDPHERSHWMEEVVFVRREGVIYRLELQAKEVASKRFELVFQQFVESFRFECANR